MSTLDWVYVGLLSTAIISGGLSLLMIFLAIKLRGRLAYLNSLKPKNKVKQKKWKIAYRKTEKKKKKQYRFLVLFLISTILFSGATFYGRYYQSTNLGQADTENIANSYNLLSSIQNEIDQALNDKEQAALNIDALAKRLSSFGMKRGSSRLAEEGQLLLNRYYNQVSQLGRNINSNLGKITEDETMQTEFRNDIGKITEQQKKIFEYYSVDENGLTTQKK